MKLNKTIFLYCLYTAAFFLVIAVILDISYFDDKTIFFVKIATIQAIVLGLFGSLSVGAIVALITYFVERAKYIKELRDILVNLYRIMLNISYRYRAYLSSGSLDDLKKLCFFEKSFSEAYKNLQNQQMTGFYGFRRKGIYALIISLASDGYVHTNLALQCLAEMNKLRCSKEIANIQREHGKPVTEKETLTYHEAMQTEATLLNIQINLYYILSIMDMVYPFSEKWNDIAIRIKMLIEEEHKLTDEKKVGDVPCPSE